jgi:UPF0755 protein
MLQDNLQQVRKPLVIAATALLVTLLIGGGAMYTSLRSVGDGSRHTDFAVKAGANLANVSARLERSQSSSTARCFSKLYMRLTGKGGRDQVRRLWPSRRHVGGERSRRRSPAARPKPSASRSPKACTTGRSPTSLLKRSSSPRAMSFLQFAAKKSILDKYKIPAQSAEGYLFPDTYFLPQGYPKDKIIEHMIEHFYEKVKEVKNFPTDPRKSARNRDSMPASSSARRN